MTSILSGNANAVVADYRKQLVEYDPGSDCAYAHFRIDTEVARTIEVLEGINIDLDSEGRVIGVEVIGLSHPLAE